VYNLGKMINLLFDTFHNTKYFNDHIYVISCHFCVGSSIDPNAMKFLWQARLDDSKLL
jgi:hypothetical protein